MGIRVAGIDARTQEEERDIRHAEWEAQYDSKQQDLGGYEVHLARQERWALQSGHLDQKGGEGLSIFRVSAVRSRGEDEW